MGIQDRFQYVHEAFTPLFSAHLYLHTNKEAFLKHRKLYTGKKMNLTGVSGASSDFNTPEGIVLLIGVFAEADSVVSALVHEALHSAAALLDRFGVKTTRNNHEPLAYMQDWIVTECMTALGAKVTFE